MKKLLCILSLTAVCGTSVARDWQPAGGHIMTRWAADVNPECPLPEYPRPQMVRVQWKNLNGLWNYAVTAKSEKASLINDGKILVPFAIESSLSGVQRPLLPSEKLWYKRTFEVPAAWKGKKVILNFGAVDYNTIVRVNGREAGRHVGSADAFSMDITKWLTDGPQELSLEILDPTDNGEQPRGKQVLSPRGIYYTAVSGIWKTVWMEPVSDTYLKRYTAIPNIDKGVLNLKAVVVNADANTVVRYTALDNGRKVAEATCPADQGTELKIADAKLWSPASPFLYDLKIEVLQNDKTTDRVDTYFGMRKISVAKDDKGIRRIMLNNEFLFQYGFLDQGWWPDGLLTAPTDEALKSDIVFTRNAGYNTIRKHIKIEPDRFYYHCDKLGMIVWQDAVSGDKFNLKNMPEGREKSELAAKRFEQELKAMIDQLINYPCIVNWVVFNEGWGQYGGRRLIDWTKRYDPSRLAEVSGWVDMGNGDIADIHRYPAPGRIEAHGERAFAVGEFGGLGLPVKGHLWDPEMNNWGYATYSDVKDFTNAYQALLFQLRTMIPQGLSAAIYTQTTDVEGEVNGMLTYDRAAEKIPAAELKAMHNKLYTSPIALKTVLADSEQVPRNWFYTTETPAEDWNKPGFKHAGWKQGEGMVGKHHPAWQLGYSIEERTAPAHLPNTGWETGDIWMVREFSLNELPQHPYLKLRFDQNAEVYINGVQIADEGRRLAHYYHTELIPITAEGVFKRGVNTIAVHAKRDKKQAGPQNQAIDAGIVDSPE